MRVRETKAVILAAGMGTRMRSRIPKVLHRLRGRPMLEHIIDSVRSCGTEEIICVVGRKAGEVKRLLKETKAVMQKRPQGSADAVLHAERHFDKFRGDVFVLCGDTPLVRPETLQRIKKRHRKNGNFCTLLTARMADPSGYGRIVRDNKGNIIKIAEETEVSETERSIDEINVGVYLFKAKELFSLLKEIKNDNKKNEYFLTDIISLMRERDLKVGSVITGDSDEALGVNTRKDLAGAEEILRHRILRDVMDKGVTVVDPGSTDIGSGVNIGKDTIIFPHTIIERDVKIGRDCRIGPFARIRPQSIVGDKVEIGNFTELVRTKIGSGSRVKHHTYLGDAIIGRDVNIGAGTITANYDGKEKHITRVGNGAFLGSGTILVAPVRIGRNAVTGAGAVVTKNHNVPPNTVVAGIPARRLRRK